ncbi:hypothetical protein Dimus_002069 [Dionaea muscipula]
MGKPEDELSLSTGVGGRVAEAAASSSASGVERECRVIQGFFRSRCLLVLLLGFAVFLSALFWLPPFLNYSDLDDPDLDPRFRGHEIVASFKLQKPISLLQDNTEQLKADILDEIEVPDAKVVILSLEGSYGPKSNITSVVFGIDPETKYSPLSSAAQSLIRDSFESLVLRQSSLKLTTSLFGVPYFFEVLRFPGGITVTPPQIAFLLQKFQISFNFTLNFSIYQIQENFSELRSQLRAGLRLASYENLYISLTNSRGSTVAPPVTVQSYVVMAVGITPSKMRLKQLAQTIKDSHGRNLGLNHTVFGKVKQVSLSSILQHLLNGSDSSSGTGTTSDYAPAPSPILLSHHHHHHQHPHHHHHNQQDPDARLAPASTPSPLPLSRPQPAMGPAASKMAATPPVESSSHAAGPPSCRFGLKRRQHTAPQTTKGSSPAPAVAPEISPYHSAPILPPPRPQAKPPAPVFQPIPSSSPLPHVIFAHADPQSGRVKNSEPPRKKEASFAPSPTTSSDTAHTQTVPWLLPLIMAFLLRP